MIVVITGGIGSGKSVITKIVASLGYKVYDCDSRAKMLMTESHKVKDSLIKAFGEKCYLSDGSIDKSYLSNIVFKDKKALKVINSIVHPAVKEDILNVYKRCAGEVLFVETAIFKESNLHDIVDRVWVVEAPIELRIERVIKRNCNSEKDVRARIENQNSSFDFIKDKDVIINDGIEPILPRIEILIKNLRSII